MRVRVRVRAYLWASSVFFAVNPRAARVLATAASTSPESIAVKVRIRARSKGRGRGR